MRRFGKEPGRGLRDDFVMTTAQRRRADIEGPSADQIDAVLRASRTLVGIAAASIAAVVSATTVSPTARPTSTKSSALSLKYL